MQKKNATDEEIYEAAKLSFCQMNLSKNFQINMRH
jgi:hypothetical protein